MIVLGLDPSLSAFGWALFDSEGDIFSRSSKRGVLAKPSKTMKTFFLRYAHYRKELRDLLPNLKFDKIGIEYPIFGSTQSSDMWGLFSFCNEVFYEQKKDVVFISNMSTKKRVKEYLNRPPKWKMQKADMIEAAERDTGGLGIWTGDEADAYWVAVSAFKLWSFLEGHLKEDDLEPWEMKQIYHEHTYVKGKKKGKVDRSGILSKKDKMLFKWSEV